MSRAEMEKVRSAAAALRQGALQDAAAVAATARQLLTMQRTTVTGGERCDRGETVTAARNRSQRRAAASCKKRAE